MAVKLIFISIIIPIENIDKCDAIGGFAGELEFKQDLVGKAVWYDDYLYRTGAMNPADVEGLVKIWKVTGLKPLRRRGLRKEWHELCVVDYHKGPTLPCEWLETDMEKHIVWRKGTDPGKIIGPEPRD